jgi:hypothetical protein
MAYLSALWMQILVRDTEDALTYIPDGKQAEST